MKYKVIILVVSVILMLGAISQTMGGLSHQAFAHHIEEFVGIDHELKSLSPLEEKFDWEIKSGDWLDINLKTNTMVIRRSDESESSQEFQIGSGLNQDGNITWAGVTYNPRTPADEWIIKEKNQQNLYWAFGTKEKDENGNMIAEQLFLRMYRNDSSGNLYRTKYGFHATPEIENIIANEDGYGSYGCLISRYQLLKFMEQIYDEQIAQGGEGLKLVTSWES
ncbi:MAG: hypothetical protein GWP15_00650 [Nitrospirae bacterium]|nr:hypothetical protein [Nitrospirota bacterium]